MAVMDIVIRATDQASHVLDSVGTKGTDVSKKLISAWNKTAVAAVAAAGAVIKYSTDFNASMANVATLIPGQVTRVNELKTSVQDMAVSVGKHTGDLADGLYQVISAFGDSADTAQVLEINAKAAAAGLASTLEAINLTSAVTKGYGDTSAAAVEKVADLAFQTVKLGQTTFPELAGSMGRVVPLASAMQLPMEELFAVMATGTGVTGAAAEVSTQLRGILQSLMAPTADMTKLIEYMGYKNGQAMLNQLGLVGSIDAMVTAAKASNMPLQKFMSSIEAQTLALALAGPQAEAYKTKLAAMMDASGLMQEAFKEQTQGVNANGFAMKQLQVELAVTAQRAGDSLAPALYIVLSNLKPLVDKVVEAVTWFSKLNPEVQTTAVMAAGLVFAIGPVVTILTGLTKAVALVTTASGVAAAAMGGLTLASGVWIPVALSLVASLGWVAYNKWKNKEASDANTKAQQEETQATRELTEAGKQDREARVALAESRITMGRAAEEATRRIDIERQAQEQAKIMAEAFAGSTQKASNVIDIYGYQIERTQKAMQLWALTTDASADSAEYLTQKKEFLNKQLEIATSRADALEQAYRKSVNTSGEFSQASMDLATKLDDAKIAQAGLKKELDETDDSMNKQIDSARKLANEYVRLAIEAGREIDPKVVRAWLSSGGVYTIPKGVDTAGMPTWLGGSAADHAVQVAGHATGGVSYKQHLAVISEGNRPEAILPLDPLQAGTRAIEQKLDSLISVTSSKSGGGKVRDLHLHIGNFIGTSKTDIKAFARLLKGYIDDEEERTGEAEGATA